MAEPQEINEATRELIGQNYASLTPDKIKEYYERGADLNALWRDGSTLLQKMCHLSQEDLNHLGLFDSVQTLLECGADPNIKDEKGRTIIDYINDTKDERAVEKLILLAKHINQETLDTIRQKDADTARIIETLAKDESDQKGQEMVEEKIEETHKMTPEEATEKLKTIRDWSTDAPVSSDELQKIKDLIQNGANVNTVLLEKENLTLAHVAAAFGDKELLQQLDEKGIDWNQVLDPEDSKGTTAHLAVQYNNDNEAIKFLVRKVDFNIPDKEGKTALDYIEETSLRTEIEALLHQKEETEKTEEEDNHKPNESDGNEEEHSVNPEDNGDDNEGEPQAVDPNDNGEEEEGDTPVPPDNEAENTAETPDADTTSSEAEKPKGTPQSKRVAGALKDASDNFFKAVFEGNNDTAEKFAQAFLMNLLAFPLDATIIYLSKKYDPDEKDLLKKILEEMQKNRENDAAQNDFNNEFEQMPQADQIRAKALSILMQGIKARNPDLFQEVSGKTPEQIAELFKNFPDKKEKFSGYLAEILNTDAGKEIAARIFPGNAQYTVDDLIGALTGERNAGRDENGNNGNGGQGGNGENNDISNRLLDVLSQQNTLYAEAQKRMTELLAGIDERYKGLLDKMDERRTQLETERLNLDKDKASLDKQKESEQLNHEKELKEKELAFKKEIAEIEARKEAERLKATKEMVEKTIQAAVDNGKIAKETADKMMDTLKQMSADTTKVQVKNAEIQGQMSADAKEMHEKDAETLGKGIETIAKTQEQITLAEKEKRLAEEKEELKRLENEKLKIEEETKARIEVAKTEAEREKIIADKEVALAKIESDKKVKLAKVKKTENELKAARILAEGKIYTDPVHPEKTTSSAGEEKTNLQKDKLPFTLPEKMSEKNKQKIIDMYHMVLNHEGSVEKKAEILSTFIKGIDEKLPQLEAITKALDIIQTHPDVLKGLLTPKGNLSTKKLDEFNKGKNKTEQLNTKTVKLALGLRKRLEEGVKAGSSSNSKDNER